MKSIRKEGRKEGRKAEGGGGGEIHCPYFGLYRNICNTVCGCKGRFKAFNLD